MHQMLHLFAGLALFFIPQLSVAQEISGSAATFRSLPTRDLSGLEPVKFSARNMPGALALSRPLRFSVHVRQLGVLEVRLSTMTPQTWQSWEEINGTLRPDTTKLVLLQGQIRVPQRKPNRRGRFKSLPLAASIIGDTLKLTFRVDGVRVTRFYGLSSNLSTAQREAGLMSAPAWALASKVCGVSAHSIDSSSDPETAALTMPLSIRIVELATDCDSECRSDLGGSAANAEIADYVNIFNTIYRDELGLTIDLVNQISRTSSSTYPTTMTNPETLLERFRTVSSDLGPVDVKHLVTGKEINGNVIGLSYVGVVCFDPGYSIGFTQHFNPLFTPITMAHEIGHNFNATHDPNNQGIMAAVLRSPPPDSFSNFSRNEITSYVNAVGGMCLALEGGGSSSSAASSIANSSSSGSGAGGGNTGGSGPSGPMADFSASYRRKAFVSQIALPSGYGGTCNVSLVGGRTRSAVVSRPKSLASALIVEGKTSLAFSASVEEVVPQSASKTLKAFVAARLSCPQGPLQTRVVGLRVSAKRQAKGLLKDTKRWLKVLQERLRLSS